MNNKAIYFIGGFIWALVSSRKAYAPNINTSIDNSIPGGVFADVYRDRECPEGQVKKPVFRRMYGVQPSQEQEARDRIYLEEAQRNAPCVSIKEAAEIRLKNKNSFLDPFAIPSSQKMR